MVVEALRAAFDRESDTRVIGLEELVEVRALMDRLEAQWLSGLVEAVRKGGVQAETGLSPTDFFADRCRRSRREARGWVTTAQRLASTTLIGPRLADGTLSLSQAKEFSRVRTKRTALLFDEHEAGLLAAGAALPVDQLSTLMGQWYRTADAATADKEGTDVEERRDLFVLPVGDSEWMLKGTLTPEQGAVVSEAIDAVTQADWDGKEETRSMGQRRADALASIARFWLDNQGKTMVHGQRPHVQVIVDVDDLVEGHDHSDDDDDCDDDEPRWKSSGRYTAPSGRKRRGGGMTSSGMWLNGPTIDRYLCDCIMTRVLKSESVILDVGRPSRTVPHALRRAVIARDRHCRYPGCDRPAAWSDIHHIKYWENGGVHSIMNCLLLCGRHHHRVHGYGERLVLHPDGRLDVTGNDGITYTSLPPPDPGRLFNPDRPVRTIDPVRRARENAAIVAALAEVQRAAVGMSTEDHRNVERAKERVRSLPRRPQRDPTDESERSSAA
jgi:hypothetical protein